MEEWRVINEFPAYEVSNKGNVRNNEYGYLLKPGVHKDSGKVTVSLYKDGKAYTRLISRLVFETFCGKERCLGLDVYHKDLDKSNNDLDNLAVGTRREVVQYAKAMRKKQLNNSVDI